jgi:hypothetical protein
MFQAPQSQRNPNYSSVDFSQNNPSNNNSGIRIMVKNNPQTTEVFNSLIKRPLPTTTANPQPYTNNFPSQSTPSNRSLERKIF